MATIFILNGPNLNRLGRRQPVIYGTQTLDDIAAMISDRAAKLGISVDMRQSNHEGHLIDWLHEAEDSGAKAVILNPGGYGHTSVALRDAVSSIATPVIEVHLSDPTIREHFRHNDLIADVAALIVKGQGAQGYLTALDAAARL
ncbi:3-dehydroquinate dehydratase [Sphingomonas sp. HDW15A]|uniref:type II 3-dehydroquinate dehydratase n=1 Tax=Sphingomonas sp. HDW15A TaxID=2714942 RepID=UPI0014094132|nr:type II 3-dehydroquinate dehydratase [Sphingomonas sp. HDW15A]QIK96446.1 3-dehydroquinate dehydratase [Sphingomonas sp. HDW15A]